MASDFQVQLLMLEHNQPHSTKEVDMEVVSVDQLLMLLLAHKPSAKEVVVSEVVVSEVVVSEDKEVTKEVVSVDKEDTKEVRKSL